MKAVLPAVDARTDLPPLVAFAPDGQASTLDYNLPTSSTYDGLRVIDLEIPLEWFAPHGCDTPAAEPDGGDGTKWPPKKRPFDDLIAGLELHTHQLEQEHDDVHAAQWHEAWNKAVDEWEAFKLGEIDVNEGFREWLKWAEGMHKIGKLQDGWHDVYSEAADDAWKRLPDELPNSSLWLPEYAAMGVQKYTVAPETGQQQYANPILLEEKADGAISTAEKIVDAAKAGSRIVPVPLQSGQMAGQTVDQPAHATPRLLLVEYYRLTSFLGDYGAGNTLNTFTLLPGEESTITIRTWKQMAETKLATSCILDSYDDSVADEFQKDVQSEHTEHQQESEAQSWGVRASASASWGWGSASASAEYKDATNEAREQGARNVKNALDKHASKASHQRKIEINTSTERKGEEGEEVLINRTIKNINLSRVMNFVFRQLNQEFITYFHLVDARIAFANGFVQHYREVPLAELESARQPGLLETYIVPGHRTDVLNMVSEIYLNARNFRDQTVRLIEQAPGGYWRVRRGHVAPDEATTDNPEDPDHPQLAAHIPGVILRKSSHVLPTDAIIVDALLGQGSRWTPTPWPASRKRCAPRAPATRCWRLKRQSCSLRCRSFGLTTLRRLPCSHRSSRSSPAHPKRVTALRRGDACGHVG